MVNYNFTTGIALMRFNFFKLSLFFITILSFSFPVLAVDRFSENIHYKRVSPSQVGMKTNNGKIEITEFFLYSCKPCFQLDPKLEKWVEDHKDKVTFTRIPAVVSPSWVPLAKAYYVAKKLNILNKTHDALFKSIHEDKKVYLNEYSLSEFYEKYGVKPDVFIREFNSQDIVDKVSDARILTVKYAFRGVPAVVINDEFKTAPFYVKDQEKMLEVMDFLLTKVTKK